MLLDDGHQVLRIVDWRYTGNPDCIGEPSVAMLMDRDVDRLRLTAGMKGVRLTPRSVRDLGGRNQHIEVRGKALSALLLTASQYTMETQ